MKKVIPITDLNPVQRQCYDDAVIAFTRIHGIIYVAHEEMTKAFDLMEELHQDRFIIGKAKRKAEQLWNRYYDFMYRHLNEDMRAFHIDYGNAIYSDIERHTEFLTGTVCEQIKKQQQRTPSDMLYARCIVARIMFTDAAIRFYDFFKDYEQQCGINFSGTFAYADPTPIAKQLDTIVEKMRLRQRPDIWKQTTCVNAYSTIIDYLSNEEFFHQKAIEATMENKTLSKEYIRNRLTTK